MRFWNGFLVHRAALSKLCLRALELLDETTTPTVIDVTGSIVFGRHGSGRFSSKPERIFCFRQ
jgi:hypothetical protein